MQKSRQPIGDQDMKKTTSKNRFCLLLGLLGILGLFSSVAALADCQLRYTATVRSLGMNDGTTGYVILDTEEGIEKSIKLDLAKIAHRRVFGTALDAYVDRTNYNAKGRLTVLANEDEHVCEHYKKGFYLTSTWSVSQLLVFAKVQKK